MATTQPPRSKRLLLTLLAIIGAGGCALGFSYRAQARAAEQMRSQAREQGLLIDGFTQALHPFSVEFRDVKLHFSAAPSIRATLDRAQLLGALSGEPRVAIDELRVQLSGEPTRVFEEWRSFPQWKGFPVTWQRLDVEYSQRELGTATLDDVQLELAGEKRVVRARVARPSPELTFSDLVFWVGKRNQLLEFGFGEAPDRPASAQLGYFASSGGAAQWMFNARHQPLRPLARAFGWEVGEAFEPARVVTSAALIVPDDRARPRRASVELGIDAWPKPAWPDASALLGDTMAFAVYFPFPDNRAAPWALPKVSVSLVLFTLTGEGSLSWGQNPNLAVEVAGKLSCAQLRGNLSPSVYLDQVRKYLGPEPKLGADQAAARLKEEVELRLKLSAGKADLSKRKALWRLTAGCGMPELSDG